MSFAPLTIGTALTLASVGISAASSVIGGISASNQYKANARIADQNAAIAEDNARTTIHQGNKTAVEQDAKTAALLGEQYAVQSASGISVNSRTSIMTRAAAARLGRMDALRIVESSRIRAKAYAQQATSFALDAANQRSAAGSSLLSGLLGATQSVIGGASSIMQVPPTRNNSLMTVPAVGVY